MLCKQEVQCEQGVVLLDPQQGPHPELNAPGRLNGHHSVLGPPNPQSPLPFLVPRY